MAIGTTTSAATARGTGRETYTLPVTPVDEKRFESEIKRIDTTLADERKNREKFETRIEKSVDDLRGEMNSRFDKMEKSVDSRFDKMEKSVDSRFDKMEKSVDSRFEKVEGQINELRRESNSHFMWMMSFLIGAILIPIALQYFAK